MLRCQLLAAGRRTMLPARQALNSERLHLDGERGVKVHHDLGPSRRASSCKALTPSLWDDLSCRGGFPTVRRHRVESLHNAGCVRICKMSHGRREITLRGFWSGREENTAWSAGAGFLCGRAAERYRGLMGHQSAYIRAGEGFAHLV